MPYPLDSLFEARIAAGRLATAHLIDLYCLNDVGDPAPLRFCDREADISYDADDHITASAQTYFSMFDRIEVERDIRFQASLATDPLKLTMDAAAAGDDSDIVGLFSDLDWHQKRVRVRLITFDPDTGASPSDPAWQWVGRMDMRQYIRAAGEPTRVVLTCHGGVFRIRGRNVKTRTHESQQRRLAGDLFFQDLPKMVGQTLNFGRTGVTLPGGRPLGQGPSPHTGHNGTELE